MRNLLFVLFFLSFILHPAGSANPPNGLHRSRSWNDLELRTGDGGPRSQGNPAAQGDCAGSAFHILACVKATGPTGSTAVIVEGQCGACSKDDLPARPFTVHFGPLAMDKKTVQVF